LLKVEKEQVLQCQPTELFYTCSLRFTEGGNSLDIE